MNLNTFHCYHAVCVHIFVIMIGLQREGQNKWQNNKWLKWNLPSTNVIACLSLFWCRTAQTFTFFTHDANSEPEVFPRKSRRNGGISRNNCPHSSEPKAIGNDFSRRHFILSLGQNRPGAELNREETKRVIINDLNNVPLNVSSC